MAGTMKAAYMTGTMGMEVREAGIPSPAEDEALIKIGYVGVCGSDLHYFSEGGIGERKVRCPFILGHEAAGVVAEVGSGVRGLRPGDRVALEPGRTCGACAYCRSGKYNLCPDVAFFATPPVDGVLREYVTHRADLCFRLPEKVSLMEGALIEPLAVGFHAALSGGARVGMRAAVTGAGCIGLVTMLALRAMGVSRVAVTDVAANRRAKALELGAAAAVDPAAPGWRDEMAEAAGESGFDLAVETSGAEAAAGQVIGMLRKGGTAVMVGYGGKATMAFPMDAAINKELTIRTIFRYRHVYPTAIEAVAEGRADVGGIVTDVFDFADVGRAMRESVERKSAIVKSVIKVDSSLG